MASAWFKKASCPIGMIAVKRIVGILKKRPRPPVAAMGDVVGDVRKNNASKTRHPQLITETQRGV